MPIGASQFYARNISALLLQLLKDGALDLDPEDEIAGRPRSPMAARSAPSRCRSCSQPAEAKA